MRRFLNNLGAPIWGKLILGLALYVTAVSSTPAQQTTNETEVSQDIFERATNFWYANMDHTGQYRGYAPNLGSDYTYPVFKAVSPGDGAGIQRAINEATNGAQRHGQWLASQPRVRHHGDLTLNVRLTGVPRLCTSHPVHIRLALQSG
jgi:hypothetical protein